MKNAHMLFCVVFAPDTEDHFLHEGDYQPFCGKVLCMCACVCAHAPGK
jgi:hypothetical protein